MESLPPDFMTTLGTGILSNAVFVVAYLVSTCLKKRVKHSECDSGCFHCKTDISTQNTIRKESNPHDDDEKRQGELSV
jgi:hypothetical protein